MEVFMGQMISEWLYSVRIGLGIANKRFCPVLLGKVIQRYRTMNYDEVKLSYMFLPRP